MNIPKIAVVVTLTAAVIGGIFYLNAQKAPRTATGEKVEVKTTMGKEDLPAGRQVKQKLYPVAKEITTPDGFINTDGQPTSIGEFVGKQVVLLDIWTYSCINCQRTTPYLNAWYEKYKDKGLVIIGLHTPEFEFEKVYQNVLEATQRLGIKYPVVLDNDYSTWNAYQNRFWPRKYLIDIDGYIVYDHIGEGGYEETEKKIQELLREREIALGVNEAISQDISKPTGTVQIDSSKPQSPEIYFGAARNEHLANGRPGLVGRQSFTATAEPGINSLQLVGDWNIQQEFATSASAGAKIIFRYHAKDVYFVAGAQDKTMITILRDGKPLSQRGDDVSSQGIAEIGVNRLYKLVEGNEYGEHLLEIQINQPGLQAFTFTFG